MPRSYPWPPILTSLRTVINAANAQGVALIAIKGLNQKLDAELASRDQDIATLKAMIRHQGTQISSMEVTTQRLAVTQAATTANSLTPRSQPITQAAWH